MSGVVRWGPSQGPPLPAINCDPVLVLLHCQALPAPRARFHVGVSCQTLCHRAVARNATSLLKAWLGVSPAWRRQCRPLHPNYAAVGRDRKPP